MIFTSVDLARPRFIGALNQISPGATPSAVTYACYAALASVYQVFASAGGGEMPRTSDEFFRRLLATSRLQLADETIELRGREAYFDLIPYSISRGKPVPLVE